VLYAIGHHTCLAVSNQMLDMLGYYVPVVLLKQLDTDSWITVLYL